MSLTSGCNVNLHYGLWLSDNFYLNFHLSRPPCRNYNYYTLIIASGITSCHCY
jgi:hypothetical protein